MDKRTRSRERWFYLMISPWLIGLVFFQGGPILAAFGLSFTEGQVAQPLQFIGLAHFQELVSDPLLRQTLSNTVYYSACVVPIGIFLGLFLAILVNQRRRGLAIFRTIYLLPAVAAGVATTLLWGWIFNPQYGLLNVLLSHIGIRGPAWLQDKQWAMPAVIIIGLWTLGTNMVLFLAALQRVPSELIEAATLDGADKLDRFRSVIWPLITPTAFYLVVINLIGAFQVFTPTYLLTRGGPDHTTLTLPLYIYLNAFAWGRMGYAAALSLLLFSILIILTVVQFRFARRWVFYSGEQA